MIITPYIFAIISAWFLAQGFKYLIISFKNHNFGAFRQLYLSGNMPSAHSATTVALLTVIGLMDGLQSGLFSLAALFSGIVMYDSMMVRRSSGEQGIAIQKLIKQQKTNIKLPRAAKGHTPTEVLAGAILGAVVGVVVFLATK